MGVAVHVYEIHVMTFCKRNKPLAALGKIGTANRHPFEAVAALNEDGIAQPGDFVALRGGGARSHRGKDKADLG
jgi:hypothetical protein